MKNLPEIAVLVTGVIVMALLLYLGAASQGWVAILCFLGAGVVYTGWHNFLLRWMGELPEDDEDED